MRLQKTHLFVAVIGSFALILGLFVLLHPTEPRVPAVQESVTAVADDSAGEEEFTFEEPQPTQREPIGITWGEHGLGQAEIPVGKDAPPLRLYVHDSMGAHCCQEVNVYDSVTMKPVYSSAQYGLEGRIRLVDLDGDGVVELLQDMDSFHYYDGFSFVDSPLTEAIFQYDRKKRVFVPAHRRFPDLWRQTLDESRQGLPRQPVIPDIDTAEDFETFLQIRRQESQAINRAVHLIFAGYEQEAYAWLQRQFAPKEGKQVCKRLRQHLATNPYYQATKPKKNKRKTMKPLKSKAEFGRTYVTSFHL